MPILDPVFEPYGSEAFRPKYLHGLDGENTIGTAAVGHDLLVSWQLRKVVLQFLERDRDCAGDMTGSVFLR